MKRVIGWTLAIGLLLGISFGYPLYKGEHDWIILGFALIGIWTGSIALSVFIAWLIAS